MGNFASSAEWLYSDEIPCQRHIITPKPATTNSSNSNNNTNNDSNNTSTDSLSRTLTKPAIDASTSDLVTLLVARAITTCKQSVHDVLSLAVGSVYTSSKLTDTVTVTDTDAESESEPVELDDIFEEFQIVYEDNYERIKAEKKKRTSESDVFKDAAPWFQYCPSDFQTIPIGDAVSVGTWKQKQTQTQTTSKSAYDSSNDKDDKDDKDDDARSATTESTDWLSDEDSAYSSDSEVESGVKSGVESENPASSVFSSSCGSEMGESIEYSHEYSHEYFHPDDDVETKAACLLRLTSTCGEDVMLFVDDYLCQCGQCPQYKLIEDDVSRGDVA